jgi:hypothetical protein
VGVFAIVSGLLRSGPGVGGDGVLSRLVISTSSSGRGNFDEVAYDRSAFDLFVEKAAPALA